MPFYKKEKSKIKMVGLTGPTFDNVTWYSPIWQNKKPAQTIIHGMLERFKKDAKYKLCVVIQFYENNQLIQEYRRE